MRIGLYGLPTAGKSYILNRISSLNVLSGSSLLKDIEPNFHNLTEELKNQVRVRLASRLKELDHFIMDGHYSFGNDVVFTNEDGQLYDAFIYLYVAPDIIKRRMSESERNNKYLQYDIEEWQKFEIESLRNYCHENDKDFYVIDNPGEGFFADVDMIIRFIDEIIGGYSCVNYAKEISDRITVGRVVSLIDGDKTYIKEDSSAVFGYKTHLFDGNFYSGFQAWRHNDEFSQYINSIKDGIKELAMKDFQLNESVQSRIEGEALILTTGYYDVWKSISEKHHIPFWGGVQMCADTKFFVAKFIQEKGCKVIAIGDSMNDYYMIKQADIGYVVLKNDGTVSSSLKGRNLEGISVV